MAMRERGGSCVRFKFPALDSLAAGRGPPELPPARWLVYSSSRATGPLSCYRYRVVWQWSYLLHGSCTDGRSPRRAATLLLLSQGGLSLNTRQEVSQRRGVQRRRRWGLRRRLGGRRRVLK